MYTANITQAGNSDTKGIFTIDVEYLKDDISIEVINYRISEPDSIKDLIKRQIAQYEKIDSINLVALVGQVDLSEPPVTLPVFDPKPEEVATFQRYKRAIDLGLLASDDTNYTSLKKKIQTNLTDYLPLL